MLRIRLARSIARSRHMLRVSAPSDRTLTLWPCTRTTTAPAAAGTAAEVQRWPGRQHHSPLSLTPGVGLVVLQEVPVFLGQPGVRVAARSLRLQTRVQRLLGLADLDPWTEKTGSKHLQPPTQTRA